MVASTQPLASEAGLRILRQGGSAADAAVAMAAALNVTEPCSTGIGGDACALFYDSSNSRVECLVGFGRSGSAFTKERVSQAGFKNHRIPPDHGLTISVPGAAQLWEDAVREWGRLSLKEVLAPAIELCEEGFTVAPRTANLWQDAFHQLKGNGCACFKSPSGKAPAAGERLNNPDLGLTFRTIGKQGTQKGFYRGRIAEAIVSAVSEFGGVLTLDDLEQHEPSEPTAPAHTQYRDYTVWEVPPPSQGLVVLAALNHLEALMTEDSIKQWGSDDVLHAQIEALRLAFYEALHCNADPFICDVPLERLVCKEEASNLRSIHKLSRQASSLKSRVAGEQYPRGDNTDTVYFCAVDNEGNACSFINSNFMCFGTGIVPERCGFSLHNRGAGFCQMESHPNFIGPFKRPYNTIIPGMCTDNDGRLFCAFGVMGGFMQPQGHLQVLSNLIDFKMNPQSALDAPRFRITGVDSAQGPDTVEYSTVSVESGFGEEVVEKLRDRGHQVTVSQDGVYGRGQIILHAPNGVLWGGTEPCADGTVLGY